jgi:putative tryptophan/tyrosine transport system substrate-binding protein
MQFDQIKRRDFITLLGGVAAAWPLATRAQSAKLPTIGFLGPSTPLAMSQWVAAFAQRLRELGWTEGRTVAVEYRWAEGRSERYAEIAAEFVRRNIDVIVTSGVAAIAAKQATSVIPIVFAVAADPVGAGLVASLARPGGNVTGFIGFEYGLSAKWLELLKEIAPSVTRAAILRDPGITGGIGQWPAIQTVAPSLGVELRPVDVRDPTETSEPSRSSRASLTAG